MVDPSRRSGLILLLAGALFGAGVILSLAPSVVKTYGALEVANTWPGQQTFSGGAIITGLTQVRSAADCTLVACMATGQMCVNGIAPCFCNVSTGFYVCNGGSVSVLKLTPLAVAPTTCAPGDVWHMVNGALCHCYATNSAEDPGSQGNCQLGGQ